MARRRAAAGRPGGGERIPALRSPRVRLSTGAAAVAVLAAVAAASDGGRFGTVAVVLGAAGAACLGAAVALRWPPLATWAVTLAAAGWVAGRNGAAPAATAAVGAGLLLAAELAHASIADDRRIAIEGRAALASAAAVAAVVAVGFAAGLLLLAAGSARVTAGVPLAVAGVVATVAATAWVLHLARPR